jgi:enamine deaminase RidA (YjgF/YER057c/UK114 family)
MRSNTKRYDLLQSCVALRNLIVQLDGGNKVTVIPGSERHDQIRQACLQLETQLQHMVFLTKGVTGAKRMPDTNVTDRSLQVRNYREKQRNAINDLIDKYFKVHGKPVRGKGDRKKRLLTKSNYKSEI